MPKNLQPSPNMMLEDKDSWAPVVLVILDGYALAGPDAGNAISLAHTPNLDTYFQKHPWCPIQASGVHVGLMPGQMGDSNVGHLNMGAGRIVQQSLPRIMNAIAQGTFQQNKELLRVIEAARLNNTALHIMGLISDGGVHSHIAQLYALLDMVAKGNPVPTYIHAFLDGRDVAPKSARDYLQQLQEKLIAYPFAQIVTISGRYYAMDRDQRWQRTEKALHAICWGQGIPITDVLEAVEGFYHLGISDEFIQPSVMVTEEGQPIATLQSGDSVILFNFRADRMRQLTTKLLESGTYQMVTMMQYDQNIPLPTAFLPLDIRNTLGEIVSDAGLKQLRLAETEKYAHVTFFFNGGRETPFKGEERVLVPSPSVATYDLQPEMSAARVAQVAVEKLCQDREERPALGVINFANCDMVGHTGDIKAAVKAVEAVDKYLGQIVEAVLSVGGICVVSSDHGNAEYMRDSTTGGRHTAHTANPVPFIIVGRKELTLRAGGRLSDVAPTILQLLGLAQPFEMTGVSLIRC